MEETHPEMVLCQVARQEKTEFVCLSVGLSGMFVLSFRSNRYVDFSETQHDDRF